VRGQAQIQQAMSEAQKAATRNGHKGDWRRLPLKALFDKLYEELDEYYEAVLSGDPQRILEELGDVIWTAIMIADHDLMLGDLEVVHESL
jgi:NTP pyrophosphatase (non-canonical NTP hydrolase)